MSLFPGAGGGSSGGGGGGSVPTGTGFVHVTGGAQDVAAKAVDTADISNKAVTSAKLADMANATVKGRNTAGAGVPEDVTMAQLRTLLALALANISDAGTVASLASDTDGTLAANSDVRIPTQKAVVSYVASKIVGLLTFKGATDCSANPNYPASVVGDAYIVSVAGKIGGASGTAVSVGDYFIATAINAGGTEAAVGTSWSHIEHQVALAAIATTGSASDLASGTVPLARLSGITDAQVDAANKDGAAGTASLRTLGSAAGKAAPGNRQFSLDGSINSPLVKNEVLSLYFPRAATIVALRGKTVSGTITLDINIGGTVVTGISAITFDSTGETATATALKTLAAGSVLNMNITGISAPVDFAWTLLLAEAD